MMVDGRPFKLRFQQGLQSSHTLMLGECTFCQVSLCSWSTRKTARRSGCRLVALDFDVLALGAPWKE